MQLAVSGKRQAGSEPSPEELGHTCQGSLEPTLLGHSRRSSLPGFLVHWMSSPCCEQRQYLPGSIVAGLPQSEKES